MSSRYRPCVGVVLANSDGCVFLGERSDVPGAWQMPQGGIDDGETPESAALRELEEETGISKRLVQMVDQVPDWIRYDLPQDLVGNAWKGRFRGQEQKWFLFLFHGTDSDIRLDLHNPEFARWKWARPSEVVEGIVPFKRAVYGQVLDHFAQHLRKPTS